jgi:hypothetical protein
VRGLNGQSLSGRSSLVLMSAGTIVLVGTVLFAAGCSTGGTGLRDGGPAHTESVAKSGSPTTTPPDHVPATTGASGRPAKKVDPVALLKADPKVSAEVKRDPSPARARSTPST